MSSSGPCRRSPIAGLTIIELFPYLSTIVVTILVGHFIAELYSPKEARLITVGTFIGMVIFWIMIFCFFRPKPKK